MNNINNTFLSIEQLQDTYLKKTDKTSGYSSGENKTDFASILTSKHNQVSQGSELRFSKHASNRLITRQIELDDTQMARISDGIERAGEKGIRDSLVIMDSLAFIVNVPSQTVITAMDQTESKDNIFTNIDGAVIM